MNRSVKFVNGICHIAYFEKNFRFFFLDIIIRLIKFLGEQNFRHPCLTDINQNYIDSFILVK